MDIYLPSVPADHSDLYVILLGKYTTVPADTVISLAVPLSNVIVPFIT